MRKKTLIFPALFIAGLLVLAGAGCPKSDNSNSSEVINKSVNTSVNENVNTAPTENDNAEADENENTTGEIIVEDADWVLVSGDPTDTCMSPTYEGSATLNGWYVYDYNYVDKDWLLEIPDDELNKLPLSEISCGDVMCDEAFAGNAHFNLVDADPDLEEEMKAASAESPVSVTVSGFGMYCEGVPALSISGLWD